MFKGMGPGGLDMSKILKQAQGFQKQLERIEAELSEVIVEASSGGGMVSAFANGQQKLVDIKIDPEVVEDDELDMLQDLIVSAVNAALEKAKNLRDEKIGKVTGGLNLPGMF